MADRPQVPPPPTRSKQRPSAFKTGYLILYNFISAILWATVLGRVLAIATLHSYVKVYLGVGEFAKWTQTMALLEVVHAGVGEFGICFPSPHHHMSPSFFLLIELFDWGREDSMWE